MDELADQYPALNAGALCLNFANTLEPQAANGEDRDHLGTDRRQVDYDGLLAWLRYAGILDDRQQEVLRADPARSAATVRAARQLRSAITKVFTAVATGTQPRPAEIDVLRKAYAGAVSAASLSADPDGWQWFWSAENDPTEALHPIAASAMSLLTGPQISRVKQCGGDRCWVLFVDTTRNGSRRWCQMRYCGNVLKSRRQAAQRRAARAASR
ncbi:ABATE domain-containing protein [Kribbella swartbergensis]